MIASLKRDCIAMPKEEKDGRKKYVRLFCRHPRAFITFIFSETDLRQIFSM